MTEEGLLDGWGRGTQGRLPEVMTFEQREASGLKEGRKPQYWVKVLWHRTEAMTEGLVAVDWAQTTWGLVGCGEDFMLH